MPDQPKTEPEMQPVRQVIEEITKLFDRPDIEGVLGFKIVVKAQNSKVSLEWGSLKMPRRR